MAANPVIRARMKAIIAAADAVLADLGARGGSQTQIKRVAQVRADALARLEG